MSCGFAILALLLATLIGCGYAGYCSVRRDRMEAKLLLSDKRATDLVYEVQQLQMALQFAQNRPGSKR